MLIVGHGELNKATSKITMGGMDPLQLSTVLKSLPTDGTTGAIKRVSLVGCSVGKLNSDGTAFVGDRFPEVLLRDMRNTVDEVSSRTGIVSVDSTGRKMYGEYTAEGLVWRLKPGTIKKTVISLDDTGNVHRIQEKISQDTETYTSPTASSETFKPTGGQVELEETGAAANPEHVKLNNDDLFDAVSSVAKEHFQTVPKDPNWDTRVEKERLVRVLDQGVPKDMKIKIREFSSYAELSQEIKRWGEKGFEFPSYDKDTKTWTTTDSTGAPFADKYVYYRYGDFVYRLKVQSDLRLTDPESPKGLDPFHTSFEGVVVNEDSNGGATKNTGLDLNQYRFGDSYAHLQPQTDNNFFPDTRKWMGGEQSEIGSTRANAINGETNIAMFTSEAIHDYRVHVTNN